MIDNIKAITENQTYIKRLFSYAQKYLVKHKPQNNYYECFSNGTSRFKFEFRKIIYNGVLIGYRHVEVCFSPHYQFNDNWHNGNDLTPVQCIKTIAEVFNKIGIADPEFSEFKIVNIEYGLNLLTGYPIEQIINGILYTRRSPFVVKNRKIPYSKISDTTKYKEIKVYAKGIQCHDALDAPHIDINTFRYEVKIKQSKKINRLGIDTVKDLLELNVFNALFQSLIDEWDNILVINTSLNNEENTPQYWNEIRLSTYRNKFYKSKTQYYKNCLPENNLHHLIKCKIIDKITEFIKGANSTQKPPINKGKSIFPNNTPTLINVEYAPTQYNNADNKSYCSVTGLDISMQKKGSKYLGLTGLKYYREHYPDTYKTLCRKYLTEKMRDRPFNDQFYYIAHNIRNTRTNPLHNRSSFIKRNYNKNQLQFKF